MLHRRFASHLITVIAALVVGWPLIAEGTSIRCGLLASGALAMLFASLIHLGASAGIGRWIWGLIAAVLSFCAPLGAEMCMTDQPRGWWLGVGVIFVSLAALIAWRSHRERQDDVGPKVDS